MSLLVSLKCISDGTTNTHQSFFCSELYNEHTHLPKIQVLSPKDFYIIAVFKFRELLTPQQHYDWGLRALKTVLRGCGNLLHQLKKSEAKKESKVDHTKLLIIWDIVQVSFTTGCLFTGVLRSCGLDLEAI